MLKQITTHKEERKWELPSNPGEDFGDGEVNGGVEIRVLGVVVSCSTFTLTIC